MPRRQIPPGRKAAYYLGMVLMGAGLLAFASVGPERHTDSPAPPPDFWERAQKGMCSNGARVFVGLGLLMIGGVLMGVGQRAATGSAPDLDSEQAAKDIEP